MKELPEAKHDGPGREAFLMRRAGVIDSEERVELCPNLILPGGLEEEHPSMNRTCPSDASTAACREDLDGHRKKNIRLLQLDSAIMNERDIDFELLEYLTSPSSVQRLNPEMWQLAWEHVCVENQFLVMEADVSEEGPGKGPYCTLCAKWAEVPHLLSDKCRQKRLSQGYAQDGPLLAAILKAEQSTGTLQQHPQHLKHLVRNAPGMRTERCDHLCLRGNTLSR